MAHLSNLGSVWNMHIFGDTAGVNRRVYCYLVKQSKHLLTLTEEVNLSKEAIELELSEVGCGLQNTPVTKHNSVLN